MGQRVVLNPWLSCGPAASTRLPGVRGRRLRAVLAASTTALLAPGIHTGNATEATGGFAELLPAHQLMVVPVPDDIPDEVAVLADPFAVALHAVTRNPPPPGGRAVVYGAGALGTTATAILAALYPDVEVATVARCGRRRPSLAAEPRRDRVRRPSRAPQLVEALADLVGRRPAHARGTGCPSRYPGGIDVVYDTVGAPETIEVGMRVLRARGTLVQLGVSSPARFEWTPWYFKELRLIGSNAFGVEEVDGRRQHAIAHYFDLRPRRAHRPRGACSPTASASTSGATRSARSSTRRRPAPSRSRSTSGRGEPAFEASECGRGRIRAGRNRGDCA